MILNKQTKSLIEQWRYHFGDLRCSLRMDGFRQIANWEKIVSNCNDIQKRKRKSQGLLGALSE